MPTKLNKSDVRNALITLLRAAFADFDPRPQVDTVSTKDVDADSNITKGPPAVLILYDETTYTPNRDITRTNYSPDQHWTALIGARSLRSPQDEQQQAMAMIDATAEALAGAKLALPDGTSSPIELVADQLIQMTDNGTWYQLTFIVRGTAQYSNK